MFGWISSLSLFYFALSTGDKVWDTAGRWSTRLWCLHLGFHWKFWVAKRGPSAISAFCVLTGPQMFFSASSFGKVRKDSEMARNRALRYELLVAEDLRAEIRVASLEGILGTAALANSSRRVARRMVASDPRNARARLEELEYLKRIHGEDGYHASWLWGLFSEAFCNCAVAAWVFLARVISTRSERLCQDAFRVNGS